MINSGQGLYELAIAIGAIKSYGHWKNLNTPTQEQWEELAKVATSNAPLSWNIEEQSSDGMLFKLEASDHLRRLVANCPKLADYINMKEGVPGCPVYSRITGSLHGYYIGKTKCGGCCIDAGDGGIDVEPFDLVTTNEADVKAIREARELEQWEITIKNSNITVLAQYLVSKNVTNPM